MTFVDVHHHLLWGLDADGPQTPRDTLAMMERACADGIRAVCATSHVMPGLRPFSKTDYLRRLEEVREVCLFHAFPLDIFAGMEVFFTEFACEMLRRGDILTLAGSDYVLVEFSPQVPYADLARGLRQIGEAGFVPVLAHAERYSCLVRRPSRLASLKADMPLRVQLNASAFIGRKGFLQGRFIRMATESGLVDFVASDA
ncbi:MAG TPA: CpsB/CapC family capsule biosynthesis tyrosine phosphatase, partial [Candidatus Limnocylindria bacterium]|nr:CpsB/CapC family capsule biosynthesis tyrosine phosphatase [Candidatus Limnocylindria bacterium]